MSHSVGTFGQQTPPRRASTDRAGDGTHMGPGNGRWCGTGCWGMGWARGRGATFGRGDTGTGWDADSGGGMRCDIMCGSYVRTRRPFGRPGASPSLVI